jgi:hypothetical protein
MWTEYKPWCTQIKDLVLFGSAERLRESVWRKRPKPWSGKWILHHDYALTPDSLKVRKFLAKKSITKRDYPPYSPDLVHCDFWPLPK